MFVVLQKDCYSGDGCDNSGQYSVCSVIGLFDIRKQAQAWIDTQNESYSIEFEIRELEIIT